jgi:hypothetical protein
VLVLAVEIVVAAAVLVCIAFLATRDDTVLDDEPTDHADLGLPVDRPLASQDVPHLRLRTVSGFWGGLRGYRFRDVDAVLAKVEETLRAHEVERHGPSAVGRDADRR